MIQSIVKQYIIQLDTLKSVFRDSESKFNELEFDKIQNSINTIENTVIHLVGIINNFESIQYNFDVESKSICKLVDWFGFNKCFNEASAKKRFINGLILIIMQDYSFDGAIFKNKQSKKHINTLLEPFVSEEQKNNYLEIKNKLKK